jgi:hypothetical protein
MLEIFSLMSTVEVMICNDDVYQMRLSLMSTVEVMICNDDAYHMSLSLMSTCISVNRICQTMCRDRKGEHEK